MTATLSEIGSVAGVRVAAWRRPLDSSQLSLRRREYARRKQPVPSWLMACRGNGLDAKRTDAFCEDHGNRVPWRFA